MRSHPISSTDFIHFIPHKKSHLQYEFLAPVVLKILEEVTKIEIVRTCSGNWVIPSHALIVPQQLLFKNEPLFTEAELKFGTTQPYAYIDSAYKTTHRSILSKIGCPTFSAQLVNSIIQSNRLVFSQKSYGWIAVLFQYLWHHPNKDPSQNVNVPLYLQLSDGTWTSVTRSKQVFLPLNYPLAIEFKSLGIAVLHGKFYEEISKNPEADLFLRRILNIKALERTDIVLAIIDRHHQVRPSASSLSIEECFDHAAYLTLHQHFLSKAEIDSLRKSFHVVNHVNRVVKLSKDVLIDRDIAMTPPTSLSRVCISSSIQFLSDRYPPEVTTFFIHPLQLQSFPPLTVDVPTDSNCRRSWSTIRSIPSPFYTDVLSPTRQGTNVLLYYLADIWDQLTNKLSKVFLDALQELKCFCENRSLAELSSCFLRTRQLDKFLTLDMNVLEVDCPEDPKWTFLKTLGVSLEPCLDIFIKHLRRKKRTPLRGIPNLADTLYKDLVMFCRGRVINSQDLR